MTHNYYYLDVSLDLAESLEVTPALFKNHVIFSVNQLFGEVAAAVPFDLLKYDLTENRAVLRVPKDHYVKLRSSLTLSGFYQGIRCTYTVHKATQIGPGKKDKIIFATKENHAIPSSIKLPDPDPQAGLILPNGDINWNCPCLGGMATGPCGVAFRKAFSCFHYSVQEPKGTDCLELFQAMQNCMQKYPSLYKKDLGDDDIALDSATVPPQEVQKDEAKKNS